VSQIIEHAVSSSERQRTQRTQHAITLAWSGGDPHVRLKHPLPAVPAHLASWRKIQIIALQCLACGNAWSVRASIARDASRQEGFLFLFRVVAYFTRFGPSRHCKACYVSLPVSNLFSSIKTWHSLALTSPGVLINAAGENGGQTC
jgi:hypothetical protein